MKSRRSLPLIMLLSCLLPFGWSEGAAETEFPPELIVRELGAELAALQRAGRIADAEAWIDRALQDMEAEPLHPLVIERQRLARLRRDFSQTPAQLLESLHRQIPDLTMEDVDRWRSAGLIQHLVIDGELLYFRREPRNLFRVSEEARNRRDAAAQREASAPEGDPNTRATSQFSLHDHLEQVLAEVERTGNERPGNVRVHATHRLIVKAGAVPEGETIRCWIPFPQEYDRQRDVQLISAGPGDPVVAPNGSGHRTVYLEGVAASAEEPTTFHVEYVYTTAAYAPRIDPAAVRAIAPDSDLFRKYTTSEPPHIDLSPAVRALAAEIVGDEANPYLAADKIFRWMDEEIRYCSEMEYSVITSITEKVLNQRAGDCGIQVLLFVALCRAAGIPARWQSGWAMRPGNENLHDWAEFYVEPYGWLPADPSFGLRRHDDLRIREFYIGGIDAFRMIANVDYAADFIPAKTHWRSDNIDNQRGEVEWRGGNLYYDDWTYRMTAEYEFLPAAEPAADSDQGSRTKVSRRP